MLTRTIPIWIAIVSGLLMLASGFLRPFMGLGDDFTDAFNVIAAIVSVLGAGSLLKANLSQVSRRDPGWGFTVVVLEIGRAHV